MGAPATSGEVESTAKLLRLAILAGELGADRVKDEARQLATRVTEGRFYVACIGQFKRGKSTLINALIGDSILPVGFIPVTAVPSVVRFGERRGARIQDQNGLWREVAVTDLKQYVSEEHNPENTKRVNGVEVFLPSPLLSAGMCLVDTPGLGSVFTGNTAATQAFIPHIDAALVVVGADPPLAHEELSLVEVVARHTRHLILVLNKADRTTDEEKSAAASFTRQLLEQRLHRNVGPIFEVSAAEWLENRGPERDRKKLVEALERLVQDSGRQLTRTAGERGLQRFSEQLLAVICEQREALQRPIEESERRIATMKETITEAERSLREMGFLFMAEQQRLSGIFADRRKTFLGRVLPQANLEFQAALQSEPHKLGPSYRRDAMREAQDIAHRHVLPWLRTEQEEAENEYRQVTRRFAQMGNDFLKKLADAGIPELARMPHALDPETGFQHRSEFSFLNLIEIAQPASPLRWLADLILGLIGAHSMIGGDARQFLAHLLEINSTRVQSDILNRVQESRGRLEREIGKLLHEISRSAEQAMIQARSAQTAGTWAVQAALARLDRLECEIHGFLPPLQEHQVLNRGIKTISPEPTA